jgi:hypothetical protein|eukprot:1532322-Prymnesium_polylepis.1
MARARAHRLAAHVPPVGARPDMLFVQPDIFDEGHVAINLSEHTLTARVELGREARMQTAVPAEAMACAFCTPHQIDSTLARAALAQLVGSTGSADAVPRQDDSAAFLMFFLLGGFVYFDWDHKVLCVNALSFRASAVALYVDGPHQATAEVGAALWSAGRMHAQALAVHREAGIAGVGWINPSERPRGATVLAAAEGGHPSGAFLCQEKASNGEMVLRVPAPCRTSEVASAGAAGHGARARCHGRRVRSGLPQRGAAGAPPGAGRQRRSEAMAAELWSHTVRYARRPESKSCRPSP